MNRAYRVGFSDKESFISATTSEYKHDQFKNPRKSRKNDFGLSRLADLDPDNVFKVCNLYRNPKNFSHQVLYVFFNCS